LAHDYEISEYWPKSAYFFEKAIKKFSVVPSNESYFDERKRTVKKTKYEARLFEILAVSSRDQKVVLLEQAQEKWRQLYSQTQNPLNYCRALEDSAKAHPEKAASIYAEMYSFLVDISDKMTNEYYKKYYDGFSKYYQGLSFFTKQAETKILTKGNCKLKLRLGS
jgi:hypothetical protein